MACVAPSYGDPFLTGILDYIDCQTLGIAGGGYQALASPAAIGAPILLALLTLFIAGLGLRILSGQAPSMGDLTILMIKVGIVLTLATTWVAYRIVVFEPVLRGPAEIASVVGRSSGISATDGSLLAQLQSADDALVRLTDLGAGRLDRGLPPAADGTAPPVAARAPLADDLAFGLARIAFLAGVIGTLGVVRLVGGISLALAPIFAGLLLFEATRSIFLGWVRILVASALGALFATLILSVELGLMLPWLESTIKLREGFYATTGAPIELLAMTLSFAIILFSAVAYAARLALFSAPANWAARFVSMAQDAPRRFRQDSEQPLRPARQTAPPSNDRVAQIVTNLTSTNAAAPSGSLMRAQESGPRTQDGRSSETGDRVGAAVPLGQRYRGTASRVVAPSPLARSPS